jgi:hypothetical protein
MRVFRDLFRSRAKRLKKTRNRLYPILCQHRHFGIIGPASLTAVAQEMRHCFETLGLSAELVIQSAGSTVFKDIPYIVINPDTTRRLPKHYSAFFVPINEQPIVFTKKTFRVLERAYSVWLTTPEHLDAFLAAGFDYRHLYFVPYPHQTSVVCAEIFQSGAFAFYVARFLLANDLIDFDTFYRHTETFVTFKDDFLCLTLPEQRERFENFQRENSYGIACFPGLRHRLGWVGCGLSYKFILRKAGQQCLDAITVCEDDVEFLSDWQHRYRLVLNALAQQQNWDIFSGLITDLSPDAHLTSIENINGEYLVLLNKTTGMVFNRYHSSSYRIFDAWDQDNRGQLNTIDRFIDAQSHIKVAALFPFLVGHQEELPSTLWSIQNTQYNSLIQKSMDTLTQKIEAFRNLPSESNVLATMP